MPSDKKKSEDNDAIDDDIILSDEEIDDDGYVDSPTEDEPIKNFFFLILIILGSPFIFIYSIFTGKPQNPIVIGGFAVIAIMGSILYLISGEEEKYDEKLVLINEMIDDLSPEERSALKSEFTTLRKSFSKNKLPKQLEPIMDLNLDMITINYYHYLVNAGYLGENAEGAVGILTNALYSGERILVEASWKCLALINTDFSKQVMDSFEKYAEERKKLMEKRANQKKMPEGSLESFSNDLKNKLIIKKQQYMINNSK